MIRTHVLPNGVKVACEERPGTGKVSMRIAFKSGSSHEAAGENGLTTLVGEVCFAGTTMRPGRDMVAQALESKGALYKNETDREETFFLAEARSKDAEEIFAVLADIVRNPTFDPAEIRLTQSQLQAFIEKSKEDPDETTYDNFFEAAFPGHAAALPPAGDAQLMGSFTPAQVKRKHAEMLAHPENITISFAGDIDSATAIQLADESFATLTRGPALKRDPMVFKGGDVRVANENEQMNILFGFEMPKLSNRDRFKYSMLQELLSGGMSSPLFQEIRDKRSLVYHVHAGTMPLEDVGIFYVNAAMGRGNAGELIKVTFDVLGDVIRNGFTDAQMELARERQVRGLEGSLERASLATGRNATQMSLLGRLISPQDLADELAQITSDDVRRVCAQMLRSGKYALSAVGPQDTMPSEQEIKEMMQKQVDGVALPPAPLPSLTRTFARAARPQTEARPATIFKSSTLSNGMLVVTAEQPGSVACGTWVDAGSDHETEELNGATHMNEHMMFKGTPSYPAGTIPRAVESLGGKLNAFTSKDRTAYYFYNLIARHVSKIMNVCADMVARANIGEKEFGTPCLDREGKPTSTAERGVVLEEIKGYNDDVGSRQDYLLDATAYPGQSHGRTILGTPKSLLGMTAADLRAYRDQYYTPNHMVSVSAGPVSHEDFVAVAEKEYGTLSPTQTPPLPEPVYVGGTAHIEMKEARLCSFTLAAEGAAATDADRIAYDVFGQMLGSGVSSPLVREIVYNKRLAPGIGSGHQNYRNAGMLVIGSIAPAAGMKPLVAAIYQEIRNFVDNPSQADLDRIKAGMELRLNMVKETSNDLCAFLGNSALTFGRLVTPDEVLANIQKLTLDDIKRVGKQILESNPTLAMVVPPGTDPKLLPTHEEVVAMRDDKKGRQPVHRLVPGVS